jgi:hypothetical protein
MKTHTDKIVSGSFLTEALKYEGKNVKCLRGLFNTQINYIVKLKWDDGCLMAVHNSPRSCCLFDNGKWASIIEEKKEDSLKKICKDAGRLMDELNRFLDSPETYIKK